MLGGRFFDDLARPAVVGFAVGGAADRVDERLVGDGAWNGVATGIDFDPKLDVRSAVHHARDAFAESHVKDDDFSIGVVDQVEELIVEIAVVDVVGNRAQLESRILCFVPCVSKAERAFIKFRHSQ